MKEVSTGGSEAPKPKGLAVGLIRTYLGIPYNRDLFLTDASKQQDALAQARVLPDRQIAPFMIQLLFAVSGENPDIRKAALMFLGQKYDVGKLNQMERRIVTDVYTKVVDQQIRLVSQAGKRYDVAIVHDLRAAGAHLRDNGLFNRDNKYEREHVMQAIRDSWEPLLQKVHIREYLTDPSGLPLMNFKKTGKKSK